jgi:hypothetical protein
MSNTELDSQVNPGQLPQDDPYVTVMEKADRRRKLLLIGIGSGTLAALGVGLFLTMQSLGRMNQDIPGVFAGVGEMAAKQPPRERLVSPPKPPSPAEFRAQLKANTLGQSTMGAESEGSVAIPVSVEEP